MLHVRKPPLLGGHVSRWQSQLIDLTYLLAVYWSLFGAIVISVVLLATCRKTDAAFIFTEFQNETGWPDAGESAWLSWLRDLFVFLAGGKGGVEKASESVRIMECFVFFLPLNSHPVYLFTNTPVLVINLCVPRLPAG